MILFQALKYELTFSDLPTQTTSRVAQAEIQDIIQLVTSQIFVKQGNYLIFWKWVHTNPEMFSQNLAQNSFCEKMGDLVTHSHCRAKI